MVGKIRRYGTIIALAASLFAALVEASPAQAVPPGAKIEATIITHRVTIDTCPIRPSACLAHFTARFRHLDRPTQRAVADFAAERVEPCAVELRVEFRNG